METITVAEINDHRRRISRLSDRRDKVRQGEDAEHKRLMYDVYAPKIRELEGEREDILRKMHEKAKTVVDKINQKISAEAELITLAKRILAYLAMPGVPVKPVEDSEVALNQHVRNQFNQPLGSLVDEDLLSVKMFILGNDKPTNRYTLAAIGRSAFRNEFPIQWQQHYGMSLTSWMNTFSIERVIRQAATAAELVTWYESHWESVLTVVLQDYERVKAEYLEARQLYTVADFGPLITDHCPECPNFRTVFDEARTRDYTPECYHHNPSIKMVKGPPGRKA